MRRVCAENTRVMAYFRYSKCRNSQDPLRIENRISTLAFYIRSNSTYFKYSDNTRCAHVFLFTSKGHQQQISSATIHFVVKLGDSDAGADR